MAKDILKEAIADAKAVREVALANAKSALEEAFTPKLNRMLSAKLSEELEEDYYEDGDDDLDDLELGEGPKKMGIKKHIKKVMNPSPQFPEPDTNFEEGVYEDEDMDEEIDLEEILNELEVEEDEANEEVVAEKKDDDDEEVNLDEMMYDEDESDLDEVHRPHYEADEVHLVNPKAEYVAENQEFDLDALLKEINDLEEEEITEDEITEKKDEEKEKVEEGCGCNEALTELEEMKSAFNTVKSELNEVNLLNSKLLYVNRIFKANNLDDAQKLRVVETLDKADSTKEAKLIYETIKDSFSIAKTKKVAKRTARKPIKEGFKGIASKASGVSRAKKTAPKRAIISESDNMVNRFQKLANIKINE